MWIRRTLVGSLAGLALLGSTLAPAARSVSAAPGITLDSTQKIHPMVQYGAQADPVRLTRVIVQKQHKDTHAADLVSRIIGARVVEEFGIIPAFVLDAPQGALPLLGANPEVRYISPDGAVQVMPQAAVARASGDAGHAKGPSHRDEHHTRLTAANLQTIYPFVVGAPAAWSGAANWDHGTLTGANTAVAIVDSGIDASHPDLAGRVVAINVNRLASGPGDGYGHGTHVAGIVGGQSADSEHLGIAPNTTLISIKVTDDRGAAYESDLLRGLDWLNQNRDQYHIRVANLSVTTSVPESYATSPIDAAVEALYHQNVTVVAAAGNLGSARDAVWYAPANDPLALTVGCLDDSATVASSDDSLCSISSRGVTEDGFAKPDVVAPGRRIVSALSSGLNGHDAVLAEQFPTRVSDRGRYIRLSGTSMAAPVVAGAIALLLERQPGLTPSQVRQIVVGTATGYPSQVGAAGVVSIPAAIAASQHPPANGQSGPLPIGGSPLPGGAHGLVWDGSNWASTYWNSAHWDTSYWDTAHWDAAYWDAAHWDTSYWDAAHWDTSYWDAAHWDAAHWNAAHWDAAHWNAAEDYD